MNKKIEETKTPEVSKVDETIEETKVADVQDTKKEIQIRDENGNITHDYIITALYNSANFLMEAGKLISPFNSFYARHLFAEAEMIAKQIEIENPSNNNECSINTTNEVEVSDEVKSEIEDLISDLEGDIDL